MKSLFLGAVIIFITQVASASAEKGIDRAWMRISDPLIMSTNFERNFSALPLTGKVSDPQKYWSSDYWARRKGGINYRWNALRPTGFNLVSPTRDEATQMSADELSTLAPSEKLDLLNGRYDYPLKNEIAVYASPSRPSWEGICEGWSAAAMNHDEPKPITLTNSDGIQIPFGSSDVKALLSWYYSRKFRGANSQMGRRCYGSNRNGSDQCEHDMNAGSFHIVISNKLGRDGTSFIADIERASEVWNHLVYDFNSVIVNANVRPLSTSAPGTVKMAQVRTKVNYVFLLENNSWEPVLGTSRQHLHSRTYEYYLDLDSTGKIIGGEWISRQRPDFLWQSRKVGQFTGLFVKMPELLNETSEMETSEEIAEDQ